MLHHHKERLESLIKEELAKILLKEITLDGALITVSDVNTSKDFKTAEVVFSCYPSDKDKTAIKMLDKNRNHLQYLLMKKIRLQNLPQIHFKLDRGAENASEVEKVLINEGKKDVFGD